MKMYEKIQDLRNELFKNNDMVTVSFVDTNNKFEIDPSVIEERLALMKENVRIYHALVEYEYQLGKIDVFVNYVWEGDYGNSFSIRETNDELRIELMTLELDSSNETEKDFIMNMMGVQERLIPTLENRLRLLNKEVE